jgi:hypothetical protein
MNDVQLLFLVLAIIYGWECACWLRRESSLFRTWLGSQWRITSPGTVMVNQNGGFTFAPPLPPLGTILMASENSLLISPKAVAIGEVLDSGAPPAVTGKCFPWNEISTIDVKGKKVLLNGELCVKAASPVLAAKIGEILRDVHQAKRGEREGLIQLHFKRIFKTNEIEDRWREFKTKTGTIRVATNVLFGHLFVLSPTLIAMFGFQKCWLLLVMIAFGVTSLIAALFHRAHKAFYLKAEDERFTHFIIILLSPATAIRALDVLSLPLLAGYHPLAVAKVFCSKRHFSEQAQNWLRQTRYTARPENRSKEPIALEIERYWRALRQETLENFLQQNGIDPEKLIQPPRPVDETCHSYCPRCRAQFTKHEGSCADCGGLTLMPLRNPYP